MKLDTKKEKFGRKLWLHDRILISCWVLSFRVQQPIRDVTRISEELRNQYGIFRSSLTPFQSGKRIKRLKRKVFAQLIFFNSSYVMVKLNAGNVRTLQLRLLRTVTAFTCIAKYLSAGMGISAAMKKASMLLNEVRNTLTPVVPTQ